MDTINLSEAVTEFDPAMYAQEVKRMRDKTVAAHNSATPFARHALTGLLTGDLSEPKIVASLIAVYKPISPKGKPGEKLSSLQYAPGGDTARKAAEKVFKIYSVRECAGVMDIIRGFCMAAVGAPKSLNALDKAVSECVKAWAEAEAEAAKAASGEEAEEPLDAPEAAPEAAAEQAAVEAIDTIRVYLASGKATAYVIDYLQALFADWQRLSAPETITLAA